MKLITSGLRCLAIVALMAISPLAAVSAPAYAIDWYSINSGGGEVSSALYKINGSIGQSVAGFVGSTSFLHWIGFWSGDVPIPTVVASADAAKRLPDGDYVSIAGKIATSAADEFEDFFYLEEANRSSGIRVAVSASSAAGLVRGHVINVIGTMGRNSAGERQIEGPIVIILSTTTPLEPIGMMTRSLGGSDIGTPPLGQYGVANGKGLNNIGLLVKTWGKVTYVDVANKYFYLDDGSSLSDGSGHMGVRVSCIGLASLPVEDTYVSVVGISSMHEPASERLPLLLPRADSDINPP